MSTRYVSKRLPNQSLPVNRNPPTDAELRMLQLVARHIDATGTQPSIRELARLLNYSSFNFVAQMIYNLRRKGIVISGGQRARGIAFNWRNYL